MPRALRILLSTLLLLMTARAVGQEVLPPPKETPPKESLPLPKETVPLPPGIIIGPALPRPTGYYRVSAYEHWQHLSPDAYGRWSPRVLNTPNGYFYSGSGQPYPYLAPTLRPTSVRAPGTLP
jgi:hypothetical protein